MDAAPIMTESAPDPLNIVIVGGGTAGWMTAAGLVGLLKPGICAVRLVESDAIGIVGVGEATLPQMHDFNNAIGIIESDMMRRTNASFKLGIEFVDWGFKGSRYIHPFGEHGRPIGGAAFHQQWVRAGRPGSLDDYSYAVVAARENRFDFPGTDRSKIDATYNYAYHIDASLYATYLRSFAERRGVTRTEGRIVAVDRHGQSGDITAVRLESGQVIDGDLFIDCSGFRALLIGETLNETWEDWSKWLPCDRALAVPCVRAGDFTPYTRSTAREAGWQWRIPLQHRTGNGYVFASGFTDEQRAADLLLANLDGVALADPRLLRFQAGRRVRGWSRNCIAIGLSSGFLEPLESTSIYLVQVAIQNLVRNLPRKQIDPVMAGEFNRLMDLEYERIRDFLILHYAATSRDDAALWRYTATMPIPDSLAEKITLFRHRGQVPKYRDGLFSPPSWLSVLLGQGIVPRGHDRLADNMPLDRVAAELDRLKRQVAERVAIMPAHALTIEDYCESDAAAALHEAVA
jgi:tryptophan halogenase